MTKEKIKKANDLMTMRAKLYDRYKSVGLTSEGTLSKITLVNDIEISVRVYESDRNSTLYLRKEFAELSGDRRDKALELTEKYVENMRRLAVLEMRKLDKEIEVL